ncbi:hypothetical protein KPL71_026862 [Citrus sinensis]|uniref:Uncharacterized protein n=1 Tax=Citrus sinensis TaxID=2711 RepID=A0ACB8I2I3_CITSI|nr:hypothetical protein KPL71_026862 [Citrus sinensis]
MLEVEVEDEVKVVVTDEVGISTTTTPIMPKEKAQPEDEVEAIQDRECKALSTKIDERVNFVEEKNGKDCTLLLSRNDTSGGQENTWYLDTGASNHMNRNRSMFMELNESVNGSVAFGDDSKVAVKGRVFKAFKKYKAAVEKESGYHIKAMRSDRGGEFTSNEFIEFFEANGIRRPLTVPRSPQQNGVEERKNRTILNMARSMLKSKRLPKKFWAETVACAVYLSNRSRTISVWGKTPQQAWSGRKPGITHLRVFGIIAHVHVLDKSRAKLDDKSEKFIFIGYDNNSKGYKLYNPNNGKIVISRFNKLKIFQRDVKPAFLNGFLDEEVCIEQPLGYSVKGHEDKVLRLKKVLYGLKQAPKAWNSRIDKYFQENGFTKCPYEHALYVKEKDGDILIVCLYVDDLIFTGSDPSLFEEFKRVMIKEFEMTDIGLMAYYLGIEVKQKKEVECGVKLSKHDEGEDIDPTFIKSLVGSLCYLTCTRSYILYAVGLVSRYMENPKTTHFKAAKRILCYIKDTINFGLLYSFSNDYKLVGYSDSNWGGDVDDRKSTIGFVFLMGDIAFTWMSKKQLIVTLSTCEAEYVAATSSVCHAMWLINLLKELSFPQEEPSEICIDNKSTIALSKNPVFHDRSKHIDTRYHFIRECIARKEVQIKYVKSQDQAVDIFTKSLKQEDFVKFRSLLGVTGSSLKGALDHKFDPR